MKKIILAQKFNSIIDISDDGFVKQIRNELKKYNALLSNFKESYHWSFTSTQMLKDDVTKVVDSLGQNKGEGFLNVNKAYHDSVEADLKALEHIFTYRMNTLLETSISLLNKGDYLSAAIISRSLVELCSVGLYHSSIIHKGYRETLDTFPSKGMLKQLCFVSALDETKDYAIWGTKLPEILEKGKGLEQLHVTKILKEVAKKTEYLKPLYEYLCEATHPNAVGNFLFIKTPKNADFTEKTMIPISNKQQGDTVVKTIERILGAISWSATSVMNMREQYKNTYLFKEKLFSEYENTLH